MPYDPAMAEKIRSFLQGTEGLTERKMFGGIGFMIGGNMAAGAHSDGRLMVRCGPADYDDYTGEAGAQGLVQGGRTMTGWVLVDADAVADEAALQRWVTRGRDHAASLPVKKKKAKK